MEKVNPINLFQGYLNQLFPKSEYGKVSSLTAFYLLILGQNVKTFANWVQAEGKRESRVSVILPQVHLNLLHVCAMLGSSEHAEKVFELKILNPNAADRMGWTFLHFAAFVHSKVLFELGQKYGVELKENLRGALPQRLQQLAYPDTKGLAFRYYNDSKNVVDGNQEDFKKLTGKELIHDVAITQDEIFADWKKGTAGSWKGDAKDWEALKQLRNSPPKLYIENRPDVNWEVRAEELITAGYFICEYVGTYSPVYEEKIGNGPSSENAYRLNEIDGKKACNEGPLTNDGVPNCLVITIPNCEGLPNRYFLKALVDLPKGTILRWDYGAVAVKFLAHKEISTDYLISTYTNLKQKWGPLHIADSKIKRKCEKVKVTNPGNPDQSYSERLAVLTLEEQDLSVKTSYLVSTPHAIILLVVSGAVSLEEVEALFKQAKSKHSNHAMIEKCIALLGWIQPDRLVEEKEYLMQHASEMNADRLFQHLLRLLPDEETLNRFVGQYFQKQT
ncbi:MAG: hypothetical protein JSR58_03440 [Verrucomicrobia bacterium]|nr:hypothetical protein [Verrucomicrobiota bacterium]